MQSIPKPLVEAQYLECKAELREATIARAQREVEDPDLYRKPDALHRELSWTIAELTRQFVRLEALYLSELGELVFVDCQAGQSQGCRIPVLHLDQADRCPTLSINPPTGRGKL